MRSSRSFGSVFVAFAAICVAGSVSATTRAQEPTLDRLLFRAGQYVTNLRQQLRGIVAEETYVQRGLSSRRRSAPTVRTLKSDLLLVRLPPFPDYLEFRDVFEVDGQPLRDREERITKLFLQDTLPTKAELQRLLDESARYNVGNVSRTINTPLLTLTYLMPDHQPRMRFRRVGNQQPTVEANPAMPDRRCDAFKVPAGTWTIEFDERQGPTVIRRANLTDFAARGKFWVEPMTGAIVASELILPSHSVTAIIVVNYQSEPLVGFRVPVAMDERYRTSSERVDACARYGRFRQFQVKTDQTIGKPPRQ
jgi:hypothetical protein